MGSLNIVDIIILGIFFVSMLIGFGRGLVSELISLATLIAALFIAIVFANPLAKAFTSSPSVQHVVNQASTTAQVNAAQPVSYVAIGVSFILLFVGVLLIGALLGYIIKAAFEVGLMGFGNRLMGALFGLIRGFFINLVFIFLVQLSPLSNESWWQHSSLVGAFQPSVQWLNALVSPTLAHLKTKVEKGIEKVNSKVQGVMN